MSFTKFPKYWILFLTLVYFGSPTCATAGNGFSVAILEENAGGGIKTPNGDTYTASKPFILDEDISYAEFAVITEYVVGIPRRRLGLFLFFKQDSWTRIWLWSRSNTPALLGVFFDQKLVAMVMVPNEGSTNLPAYSTLSKQEINDLNFEVLEALSDKARLEPEAVMSWSKEMLQKYGPSNYLLDRYIWATTETRKCNEARVAFEKYGFQLGQYRHADYVIECYFDLGEYEYPLSWATTLFNRDRYHGGYIKLRAFKNAAERKPELKPRFAKQIEDWLPSVPDGRQLDQLRRDLKALMKEYQKSNGA